MKKVPFNRAVASMPFVLGGKEYLIVGGPYHAKPMDMAGVKMAAEIDAPCHVDVPTVDFGIPSTTRVRRGLVQAVNLLLEGKDLYVGCMGGVGRTGLFLACMAKLSGESYPVDYVRKHFKSHAVETSNQKRFVDDIEVRDLQNRIANVLFLRKWLGWVPFTKFSVPLDGL